MTEDDCRHAEVERVGRQIMRFMVLLKRRAAAFGHANEDGIEYASYGLLAHLVVEGPKRTTALAEAVHSDTSTVSRQTAALVRHGLLERRPDPVDGRACILAPTPEGERVFDEGRRRNNQAMAAILGEWSPSEVNQLAELLGRLNTDLEARYRSTDAGGDSHQIGLEGRRR